MLRSMSADNAVTVDVVVIGAGPGGEALASGAARAGLEVVVVDRHLVGGECPYYGCIPSKMMIRAADALAEARRVAILAGDAVVTPSWAPVARRLDEEATSGWDDTIAVKRLEDAGATVHHGVLDQPRRGPCHRAPGLAGGRRRWSDRV